MSLVASAIGAVERMPLPDAMTRAGIDLLVGRTRRRLAHAPVLDHRFADAMTGFQVAEDAAAANRQHYELPPEFFGHVLGPRRKYSCCLYRDAERDARRSGDSGARCDHRAGGSRDGQRILELGCGWGSLSLLMAQRYPNAHITAVSNSAPQRLYIAARAR